MAAPIIEQSSALTAMAEHFNAALLDNKLDLSRIMFTWTRAHQVTGGFFASNKWEGEDGERVHELAINANVMRSMTLTELAGIMVHEMVHAYLWQEGRPGRPGYHTAEYCDMLRGFGLIPINPKTQEEIPSGKGTGPCAQRVVDDVHTAFQQAFLNMPEDAIPPYSSDPDPQDDKPGGGSGGGEGGDGRGGGGEQEPDEQPKKSGARAKYTCSYCGLNAWAKPGASLLCGCNALAMIEAKS